MPGRVGRAEAIAHCLPVSVSTRDDGILYDSAIPSRGFIYVIIRDEEQGAYMNPDPQWPGKLGTSGLVSAFGEILEEWVVRAAGPMVSGGQVDGVLTRHLGGCAVNVAVACVASKTPARVIGHAGDDETGTALLDALKRTGAEVFVRRIGRSARSLCVIDSVGERSLVFDAGDSRSCLSEPIQGSALLGVRVLHVNSHHLYSRVTRGACGQMIESLDRRRVSLSLDVSSANGLCSFGRDRYLESLRKWCPSLLFCNEAEARVLGFKIPEFGLPDPDALLHETLQAVGIVIVHRGQRPTVVVTSAGSWAVPVVEMEGPATDSTGAGDAFAGGVLAGWAQSLAPIEAVRLGHARSAEAASRVGSQAALE